MLCIARAVAFSQPRATANHNHCQIRTKFPSLRRKIRKKREKKLAKRQAKLLGEVQPQEDVGRLPIGICKEETLAILRTHCRNRDISLNKRQMNKPWIMSLLVHRYDKGIRNRDELEAGGLRNVLTPGHDITHKYILANIPETDEHRFAKSRYKKARETIRLQRMAVFAKEAWHVMMERNIPFPTSIPTMKAKLEEDPPVFLSLFSRAMAKAEPDGLPRDYSSQGKENDESSNEHPLKMDS